MSIISDVHSSCGRRELAKSKKIRPMMFAVYVIRNCSLKAWCGHANMHRGYQLNTSRINVRTKAYYYAWYIAMWYVVIGNCANRERSNPCTTKCRLHLPNWAARDKHTVEDSRYQISLDSISFAGYRKCAIIHSGFATVPVRKTVEITGVTYWACQFHLAIIRSRHLLASNLHL